MRDRELWVRLSVYEFDGAGSAPFSVKRARADGWTAAFTTRVIEEYRRFLNLTQIRETREVPSRIVDAAWHRHLTFTRDYWEDLCPNVIGAPVHHQPCAGEEEMPRYRDQFAATKALYEAEFGHEPPRDIWARDAVPRRPFLLSKVGAGNSSARGIAFFLFFALGFIAILDLTGAIIGITVSVYLVIGGSLSFFLLRGFGPRLRRRKGKDVAVDGREWD